VITLFLFVAQYTIVTYGGEFVRVTPLTLQQNLVCVGFGAFTIPWALLIKFVLPAKLFDGIGQQRENQIEVPDDEDSFVSTDLRKSLSRSLTRSQKQLRSIS
jgi:hypothetical protein